MKTPRAPLPVARVEQDGCRVDIYAPRDGVWPLEYYPVESAGGSWPLQRVNVAAHDLKSAEAEARRILAPGGRTR